MSNAVLSMGHPGLSIYATFVGVWANRPHGLSFQNDGDCNFYILWPQCRLSDTFFAAVYDYIAETVFINSISNALKLKLLIYVV